MRFPGATRPGYTPIDSGYSQPVAPLPLMTGHYCSQIGLRSTVPPTSVDVRDVYFAFPSGRLTYDCQACGATCCRGRGYAVNGGDELLVQLSYRPRVALFMEQQSSNGYTTVNNLSPACFFLDDDGRCNIHRTHGFDAKPEVCRLFPFNNLRRVGQYLIVEPHPMCPINVAAMGTYDSKSSHRLLVDTMRTHGIGANIPTAESIIGDPALHIALERRIVDLSEMYLADGGGLCQFVDAQMEATREALRQGGVNVVEPRIASARTLLRLAAQALGVSEVERNLPCEDLRRVIIASTPLLRARLSFGNGMQACADPVGFLRRLPLAVLTTYAMARAAQLAGMRTITCQTVQNVLGTFRQLIWLLARLDAVLVLRSDQPVALRLSEQRASVRRAYVRVVKALLPREQRHARRRLSEILGDEGHLGEVERVMWLKTIAKMLGDRVRTIDDDELHCSNSWTRGRAHLQHLLLQAATEEAIVSLTWRA